MPINCYTGLMGSGKSYECVSSVIVPAIKAGRRVVTNVDGIDSDAIRAYCIDKFKSKEEDLGTVVHCKNDDVHRHDFLPFGEDVDTFCQAGDMVCIDEAWRFWGTDCKLIKEHKIFFREHRHYVDEKTKVSCDLVLMVQDISDLHRTLKVVVEVAFRTTKIKTLGWNNTYRVEMWEGYRLSPRSRVSVQNKKYDKEIFPLYSSYVGGKGKELQVDDRQNVLKNPKLWFMAIGVLLMGATGLYFALDFFNGGAFKAKEAEQSLMATDLNKNTTNPNQLDTSSSASPAQTAVSQTWRIVGVIQSNGEHLIAIANPAGRIRFEHPSSFQLSGRSMVGFIDGERITFWSGAIPKIGTVQGVIQ